MSTLPENDGTKNPASRLAAGESKGRAKESFLNWWGFIPAAVFIGLEVLFCRPAGDPNAGDVDRLVGYVCGHAIFGIVISLFAAYLMYMLTRKSRLVSTLAFSFGMVFFSLVMLATAANQRAHANVQGPGTLRAEPARHN